MILSELFTNDNVLGYTIPDTHHRKRKKTILMGTSPSNTALENTTPVNTDLPATSTSSLGESEKHPRLPCRGCMADCPNYATCDGMPWRNVS
jgi:hypothetical protein